MKSEPSTFRSSTAPAYIMGMAILAVFAFIGQAPASPAPTPAPAAPPVLASFAPTPSLAPLGDPAPVNVLLLGDSHTTQTFGQALDLLLRSRPNTAVKTVGSCGISPDGFLEGKTTRCGYLTIDEESVAKRVRQRTPHIDALIDQAQPDVTIVELGANLLFKMEQNRDKATNDIRTLASKIADKSQCVWIGPPYGSNQKKPHHMMDNLYTLIQEALPDDCRFLDSRPSSMPFLDYENVAKAGATRGDGKHFDHLGLSGRHAARRWALAVFDFVTPLLDEVGDAKPRLPTRLAQGF